MGATHELSFKQFTKPTNFMNYSNLDFTILKTKPSLSKALSGDDVMLLGYMLEFSMVGKMRTVEEEGSTFHWFNYKHLTENCWAAQGLTKAAITKRFNKYMTLGLIKLKKVAQSVYVSFTEALEELSLVDAEALGKKAKKLGRPAKKQKQAKTVYLGKQHRLPEETHKRISNKRIDYTNYPPAFAVGQEHSSSSPVPRSNLAPHGATADMIAHYQSTEELRERKEATQVEVGDMLKRLYSDNPFHSIERIRKRYGQAMGELQNLPWVKDIPWYLFSRTRKLLAKDGQEWEGNPLGADLDYERHRQSELSFVKYCFTKLSQQKHGRKISA